MIPYLEEIACNEGKMDERGFLTVMALAQTFPGAMGVNAAALIGHRIRGWKGAVTAVLGVTLPSILCASLLFIFLIKVGHTKWLSDVVATLKAALVGIILGLVINLSTRSWEDPWELVCGLGAFLLFYGFKASPVFLLLGGALAGILLFTPRKDV